MKEENLKEILISLRDGKELVLHTIKNQYGDEIRFETLFFKNGEWFTWFINCWSSSDYGLGTCQCNSHPPCDTRRISRKEALSLIRNFLLKKEEEERSKKEEIEFLDKIINEL